MAKLLAPSDQEYEDNEGSKNIEANVHVVIFELQGGNGEPEQVNPHYGLVPPVKRRFKQQHELKHGNGWNDTKN